MNLYLRLAWRNVWRHRRRTIIVVLAIGLGLGMMMFYDGMMAGFNDAIYANAVKVLGGNIQIHATGYSEKPDQTPLLPVQNDQAVVKAALAEPQVVAATRRIKTGGLASNRKGAFPVGIIGIEPEQEKPVNLTAQHVVDGRYLAADDKDMVFVGKGLADAMEIKTGDRITLVGQATHKQMRQRTMTVAGIYNLGMTDIEKQSVYISLGEAQDLYGLAGQSTEVTIALKQLGEEPAVIRELSSSLSGYEISSWQTNYPELTLAMNNKNGIMNIFSVIILVIAGIGILNMLLMAVYERTREIGLMGALGMKPREISNLFVLEGAMMGLIGVVFGIALGLSFNLLFSKVGFDYSKFASMTSYTALITTRVYTTLGLQNLAQRVITVIVISVLASFYPAHEASQSEPAQALHYV
jgi:ABC-type lipoprotein release transport system permease subunit